MGVWGDLLWVGIALLVVVAGWLTMRRGSLQRRRQAWIAEQLAAAERSVPGGLSDDEYLLRLDALEEEWDRRHGAG